MKGASCPEPRWIRCSCASHWPVMAGLFTSGWTISMSRIPLAVASRLLPARTMYSRFRSTSMIAARVAGVPRPVSFMASESSFSSRVLPAVSIAVSSVPSVRRLGGRVVLRNDLASRTSCGWSLARFAGKEGVSSAARFRSAISRTFQPTCWIAVPEVWKRSVTGGLAIAVITVVTAQMWSSCQALRRRRQMRS